MTTPKRTIKEKYYKFIYKRATSALRELRAIETSSAGHIDVLTAYELTEEIRKTKAFQECMEGEQRDRYYQGYLDGKTHNEAIVNDVELSTLCNIRTFYSKKGKLPRNLSELKNFIEKIQEKAIRKAYGKPI